jgi:hypothetical protein
MEVGADDGVGHARSSDPCCSWRVPSALGCGLHRLEMLCKLARSLERSVTPAAPALAQRVSRRCSGIDRRGAAAARHAGHNCVVHLLMSCDSERSSRMASSAACFRVHWKSCIAATFCLISGHRALLHVFFALHHNCTLPRGHEKLSSAVVKALPG